MNKVSFLFVAGLLLPALALADDGDDTLNYYLSKSDLVIEAKITSQAIGVIHELGVVNYHCDVFVKDVVSGDLKLKGTTIKATIKRFENSPKDKNSLIKKDAECILFLKKKRPGNIPGWVTSDFWFGVQNPGPWMVRSLKRVAKNEMLLQTDTADFIAWPVPLNRRPGL